MKGPPTEHLTQMMSSLGTMFTCARAQGLGLYFEDTSAPPRQPRGQQGRCVHRVSSMRVPQRYVVNQKCFSSRDEERATLWVAINNSQNIHTHITYGILLLIEEGYFSNTCFSNTPNLNIKQASSKCRVLNPRGSRIQKCYGFTMPMD